MIPEKRVKGAPPTMQLTLWSPESETGQGQTMKGRITSSSMPELRRENPKQTEAIWTEQYVKKYFRTKWGLSKECKVSFTLGQLPY